MAEIPEQNRLSTQTFTAWADAFTPDELDAIEAYGDAQAKEKAILLAESPEKEIIDQIRITQTAWIQQRAQTQWIYDRMEKTVRALNAQSWKYELNGFSEPFQYTVYHQDEGGHYDWHVDHGPLKFQRKLSISLQLSDGDAYEGCDLQFMAGNKMETAPRERGAIIAFPSYVLHRVTPVTRGVRKSVVVWTTGPNFR
jgi:PKHD-type hydroxylase